MQLHTSVSNLHHPHPGGGGPFLRSHSHVHLPNLASNTQPTPGHIGGCNGGGSGGGGETTMSASGPVPTQMTMAPVPTPLQAVRSHHSYHHPHHHGPHRGVPNGFYMPHHGHGHHPAPVGMVYVARQLVHFVPNGLPAAVFVPPPPPPNGVGEMMTAAQVQQANSQHQMQQQLPTTGSNERPTGPDGVYHHALCTSAQLTPEAQYYYATTMCPDKDPSMEGMTVVWNWNLQKEIRKISHLIKDGQYNYIGMDTEFPGFLYKHFNYRGRFDRDRSYRIFKANVDSMKVIQLGITLFDDQGNLCPDNHTWQFNFCFDIKNDRYSLPSINFLRDNGINLPLHRSFGINWREFSALLIESGLVCSNRVKYITFHGLYDVGYLMKLLLGTLLPVTERQFFEEFKIYFPYIYDLRHLVLRLRGDFDGGLQRLSEFLQVERIGRKHNGGSDAYVTGRCFFEIRKLMEVRGLAFSNFDLNGKLWGMSNSFSDIRNDPDYYDPMAISDQVKTVKKARRRAWESRSLTDEHDSGASSGSSPRSTPTSSDDIYESPNEEGDMEEGLEDLRMYGEWATLSDSDPENHVLSKKSRTSSLDSLLEEKKEAPRTSYASVASKSASALALYPSTSSQSASTSFKSKSTPLTPGDDFFKYILSDSFDPAKILYVNGMTRTTSRFMPIFEKYYEVSFSSSTSEPIWVARCSGDGGESQQQQEPSHVSGTSTITYNN